MKRALNRAMALVLMMALCLGMLPVQAGAAGEALTLTQVKTLLNAEELHPQKTGYPELDGLLEQILKPYAQKDTYAKIRGMYDWTVEKVSYSWQGYSQTFAPAYDKFTLKYDLAYEEGLPEAYPKDMIYRAYHMLTAKTGVCYDWGILFAIMARYVGIESYVHTGILRIGSWTGHHGWTELVLGGKHYIFDAQQDNRDLKDVLGRNDHAHFGIPVPAARWQQETAANAARDASLLPLTAERKRVARVAVVASGGRLIQGVGSYDWGETATVTPFNDYSLTGWYDEKGNLLSTGLSYTFPAESASTTLYALFAGDRFADLAANAWYVEDVNEAARRGLILGSTEVTFVPDGYLTRAMLATLLSRAAGESGTADLSSFKDVPPEAWYAHPVAWAQETGVIQGVSEDRFAPLRNVTREQAAAMIVRYLEMRGVFANSGETAFTDQEEISAYAREAVGKAAALGILRGYEDGTARPDQSITRAEGAALLMRTVRCLESAG